MSRNKHLEDDEQAAFFGYAFHTKALRWLHAIPNGGKRGIREATRLKKQGVRAGVHDCFLPKARGVYHGMWLEMKVGKNKLTEKQIEFALDIAAEGYCMFTCYSAGEAIEATKFYLKLEPGESISSACPFLSANYIGS